MPSLECYAYTQTNEEFGEPWLKGRRQVPFGFGWLAEGASPYHELPVRAARLAYGEYTSDMDLSEQALRSALGRGLCGSHWGPVQVEDTLELCRVFGTDRDWAVPANSVVVNINKSQASRLTTSANDPHKNRLVVTFAVTFRGI